MVVLDDNWQPFSLIITRYMSLLIMFNYILLTVLAQWLRLVVSRAFHGSRTSTPRGTPPSDDGPTIGQNNGVNESILDACYKQLENTDT